ncbi:hypothetical protein M9434_003732 [Picochlorum sp. BPE23]|nr:hypothetical protein M9434_003732 [Picochlorum sp. BPE23]
MDPHEEEWFPDLTLKRVSDDGEVDSYDVVIAGAGPSGLAVASRVAGAGFKVAVIDPQPLGQWINNYGVWVDEFNAMGLDDCFDVVWPTATVHLNSSSDGERTLKRPYARVDRPKLKRKLLQQCIDNGVEFKYAKVRDSSVMDEVTAVVCDDGTRVKGTFAVDATGHSKALIKYDGKYDPGYQGAYGITVNVESHPFDVDKMLFMDWRDDHLDGYPELKESNAKLPTFLYAMPFSPTKVFLEETSLVARPIIPFPELKARLDARMAHLGIKVLSVEEEEYCSIPMGGILPRLPQRMIGVGGTAGMVHPSTGYMIARVLGAAPTVADALIDELSSLGGQDKANWSPSKSSEIDLDQASEEVWSKIWPNSRIRQREFFNFGMEVLLKLDLAETREFFAAFFALSDYHWQGFLSSRLSFIELIGFGLSLFAKSSNEARLNLLSKGFPGLVVTLAKLTKTL